jgi:hypothetical protein
VQAKTKSSVKTKNTERKVDDSFMAIKLIDEEKYRVN